MFVVGVDCKEVVKTMKLSQPNDVVKVSLKTPAVVMVLPLNTIELPLQIACAMLVVGVGLMVTVKTIKLSQPSDVINVSRYEPAEEIVFPLNTIELPLQMDCAILVVGVGLMVVVNTIKLSQPNEVVKVSLNVPAVLMVFPLNTIELP